MAVTSGFFNSINGDRRYDVFQFSSVFDGLIQDGIFASIGTGFAVTVGTQMSVYIGIGKAWFNHTWILNDSILPLTLNSPESLLDRIDTVILDIDYTDAIRRNNIIILKGTPASNPRPPVLLREPNHNQYALADVSVKHGVSAIRPADITNRIGLDTPFVTGIVDTIDVYDFFSSWSDKLNIILERAQSQQANMEQISLAWYNEWKENNTNWTESQKSEFEAWYELLRDDFGSINPWANMQIKLDDLDRRELRHWLDVVERTTTVTKDSSGKTTLIHEDSDEVIIDTTFSETINDKTIISDIKPSLGYWNYLKTVRISKTSTPKVVSEIYEKIGKSGKTLVYVDGPAHGKGSDGVFWNGILLPNDKVLLSPRYSPNIGLYNITSNTYSDGPAHGKGNNGFIGAVLMPNNKVLFSPYLSPNIGLYDISTNAYSNGPAHGKGSSAFSNAVLLPNNKVLLVPLNSPNIGLYDISSNTYSDGPVHGKEENAFRDGVLLNNKVLLNLNSPPSVGFYDIGSNTYSDGLIFNKEVGAFAATILMPNNKVLFSPYNSPNIGLYDISSNTYTDGPAHGKGSSAFWGAVLMPNDKVLLAPYNSPNIGLVQYV